MESELRLRLPGWEEVFDEQRPTIVRRLWQIEPLLAHGSLWSFIDSYRIVSEALVMRGSRPVEDRKEFMRACASPRQTAGPAKESHT